MRVAICLSGEMRGDPFCLAMLEERIIEPFRKAGATTIDLFCHTRKDQWWGPAADLNFRCLWVEENRPRDTSFILSQHNPPHLGDRSGEDRRAYLYQSYLQQYYSMEACGIMLDRAVRQDRLPYAWVIRTRPDIYLAEPLPVESLDPDVVSCPWNDWWPYEVEGKRVETVNDRFAVGSYSQMQHYLDKMIYLREFCQKFRLQGEWFTAWQMNRGGVPWIRHDKIKCHQSANLYQFSERP